MQRWVRQWIAVALLGATTVATRAASSSDYLVSRELSAASFTVYKWTVLKEEGRFNDISGRVHYDPTRPQDSTVDLTITAASLDTNNSSRDDVLRSDDFFDVQRYPTLWFVSTRVVERPDKRLAVSGELTIHGVTKAIEVNVTVNGINNVEHVGQVAGFETTFHIDRTAFGVNGTRWTGGKLLISNDVELHLSIAATEHALYVHTGEQG